MFAERTIQELGFSEILRALSGHCRTEAGRARALTRPFLGSLSEVHDALALVAEARKLREEPLTLPIAGMLDARPQLERATKGALLEPAELQAITHALFAFEHTRETLEARTETLPRFASFVRRIPQLERLATRLDRAIEPSGAISDRASPELRDARERTRGLHRNIKARIDKMLEDEKFSVHLRESYFSVRNDRYVVPVLAQSRAAVPGIVHNASQSGQTLFVEPQELIGLGNELAIAQSLVAEEERRVLLELSGAVGHHAAEIADGIAACGELDEAEAAGLLASELQLTTPALELPGGPIDLRALRHPLLLLAGKEVVANDVQLVGDARSLVLSGPNAGGKTVTLTAVGLCALLLRTGLPIPAKEGSRLPVFDSVHSAIGDAQDLSQGLSSFSAHVLELRNISATAAKGSLVLVDEIASDTDPKEGAAIAIAVLEDLLERGAMVLVTTHLEELKALAHLDPRFVNARVGFDSKRMAPTFRLQLGAAGTSSAIDIASRMGLSEKVCTRARELMLGSGGTLARALNALEAERRQLAEELSRAKTLEQQASQAKAAAETALAELERRRTEEELKFRESLQAELGFAHEQIRQLLAKLREETSTRNLEEMRRELARRQEEQQRAASQARAKLAGEPLPSEPAPLKVGARVRHLGLDKDVEILELDGDSAMVAAGAIRMRVPVADLGAARKSGGTPSRFPSSDKRQERLEKARQAAPGGLERSLQRCDVRGQSSDEALRNVEQFLDRAFQGGIEGAIIVHGHGTGALKQALRSYLSSSPYVQEFRPGDRHEGGDGATVVMFRG